MEFKNTPTEYDPRTSQDTVVIQSYDGSALAGVSINRPVPRATATPREQPPSQTPTNEVASAETQQERSTPHITVINDDTSVAVVKGDYYSAVKQVESTATWGQIIVPTVADFEGILTVLRKEMKLPESFIKENMDYAVPHESQHATAYERLGSTAIRFGVDLKIVPDPEDPPYRMLNFNYFTTALLEMDGSIIDLAIAAGNIYPYEPSRGDLAIIKNMGFKDKHEVLTHILRYNDTVQPKDRLPLPTWYQDY